MNLADKCEEGTVHCARRVTDVSKERERNDEHEGGDCVDPVACHLG